MSNETTITITGNVVADAELRYTPSGQPVARFRVASTPRYYDKAAGEWKDGESLFLTCQAWKQLGENVAESVRQGTRVIVTGRLRQRTYETKEHEKRTVYEVEADDVAVSLLRGYREGHQCHPHRRRRGGQSAGQRPGRGPVGQRQARRVQR